MKLIDLLKFYLDKKESRVEKYTVSDDDIVSILVQPPMDHLPANPPQWGSPEDTNLLRDNNGRNNPHHMFDMNAQEPEYEGEMSERDFINAVKKKLNNIAWMFENNGLFVKYDSKRRVAMPLPNWRDYAIEEEYISEIRGRLRKAEALINKRAKSLAGKVRDEVKKDGVRLEAGAA